MLDKIKSLIREKNLCVLATVSDHKPHCSLMLYAANDDCREIYLATSRNTSKYRNLKQNPAVSLLIDTRDTAPGTDHAESKALTISGVFEEIRDSRKIDAVRKRLLEKHPGNESFLQDPELEMVCIRVETFQLLEGLSKVHIEKI